MDKYPIFTQRLAGYLMLSGFKLISIEPNRNRPYLNVFYFQDTEALHKKIRSFSQVKNLRSYVG